MLYLFGDDVGEIEGNTWKESEIELTSGTLITAVGQGQAIRGGKHLRHRPDYLFVDDLEDQESVATPASRKKLSDWYWSDLIPALAPPGERRIRVAATPLGVEALAVELTKHPDYKTLKVPIEYIDENGERQSSWPSRFPLEVCDSIKASLLSAGKPDVWAREYMVEPVDPASQLFKDDTFRFMPMVRTWHPVYIAYDPARTAKGTSCMTGIVAASFVGNKIIVWEARGERWLPDEIINDIFRMEEKYEPVAIGIEPTGLEEFIRQPLRHEQIARGRLLPLRDLKPPRGKDEFIGRLQPMFAAGDVIFAGARENFAEACAQFREFPCGFKDIPNAMAYLPEMRGGVPVYDSFGEQNIFDGRLRPMGPYTLAVNAGSYGTTAVLYQLAGGIVLIHRDWLDENMPSVVLAQILEEVRNVTGHDPTVVCPPYHFDTRNAFGLLYAARGIAALQKGGDPEVGRERVQQLLRSEVRGSPCLLIGEQASYSKRAFAGGYSWDTGRQTPRPGLYATLMAGLESSVARGAFVPSNTQQPTARTPDGQVYETAMVRNTRRT